MTQTIFITGTDTDIGKTYVSCLLLKKWNDMELKTFGMKPIASGCQKDNEGNLKNQDALYLQQYASIKKSYSTVNPIAFQMSIAPHIAAEKMNLKLSKDELSQFILSSIQKEADINLIEGVGGWLVPLNEKELIADVIVELGIPIILVVGIKLGCLNHALLTYQNILAKGAVLLGWIANCLEPEMLFVNENIQTLKNHIQAPCLEVVSYGCKSLKLKGCL